MDGFRHPTPCFETVSGGDCGDVQSLLPSGCRAGLSRATGSAGGSIEQAASVMMKGR